MHDKRQDGLDSHRDHHISYMLDLTRFDMGDFKYNMSKKFKMIKNFKFNTQN